MINQALKDNFLNAIKQDKPIIQALFLEMFERNDDVKDFFKNYKFYTGFGGLEDYYANKNLHINITEFIDDIARLPDNALSQYYNDEINLFFILNAKNEKFTGVDLIFHLFKESRKQKNSHFSEQLSEIFKIFIRHFLSYENFVKNYEKIKVKADEKFCRFSDEMEKYYIHYQKNKAEEDEIIARANEEYEFMYSEEANEWGNQTPSQWEIDYNKKFTNVCDELKLKRSDELLISYYGLKFYMPPKLFNKDKEVNDIVRILSRPQNNAILLVDKSGLDYTKTAIIQGFTEKLLLKELPQKFRNKTVYKVDICELQKVEDGEDELVPWLRDKKDKAIFFVDNCDKYAYGLRSLLKVFAGTICVFISKKGKLELTADSIKSYNDDLNNLTIEDDKTMLSILNAFSAKLPEKDFFVNCNEIEISKLDENEMTQIIKYEMEKIFISYNVKFSDEILKQAVSLAKNRLGDDKDSVVNFIYDIIAKIQMKEVGKNSGVVAVSKNDIQETFMQITNQEINLSRKSILNLEKNIKTEIFGQDEAVQTLCNALIRSYAGFKRENSPIGVFLFTGNTGTGKTELAKVLAKNLGFHFSRYDMSEYQGKENIETLIGSPRGYRDNEKGGLLVNDIKENPFSVVLFDEIEKAHTNATRLFLQIFDNATLRDGTGENKADFNNTIIIMTSNLLTEEFKIAQVGFGQENLVHKNDGVKNFFSPELLNRITKIIHFDDLSFEILDKILDKYILDIESRAKNLKIILTKEARKFLIKNNSGKNFGARKLRRALEEEIIDSISVAKLSGNLEKNSVVTVRSDGKKIFLEFENNVV